MADPQLFHIDVIVADGVTLDFEDSTGTISGAAGYENSPVLGAGDNDDSVTRKRVPRTLRMKLMWSSTTDPDALVKMRNAQISMRDAVTGRKCLANRSCFASLGDIGGGSVDVTFNLLSKLQWL
jgi:hypothetical protein